VVAVVRLGDEGRFGAVGEDGVEPVDGEQFPLPLADGGGLRRFTRPTISRAVTWCFRGLEVNAV